MNAWPWALAICIVAATASVASAQPEWPGGAYNPYDHVPITVHLDTRNLTADTAGYETEFERALAYWERGGNGQLEWAPAFDRVENASTADIRAWFVDAQSVTCSAGKAGAGCGGYGTGDVPGVVYLAMKRAGDGMYLSFADVRETAKHEIGHALGLGHSEDPEDVMFPEGHSVRGALSPGWEKRSLWAAGLAGAALVIGGAVKLGDIVRTRKLQRAMREWERGQR